MNNPLQGPVTRPKQFVSSVFDLAYGARDGSEPLTAAEVNANLRESGINPDAAWSAASKILAASRDRLLLVEARRQRLADLAVEAKESAQRTESRESIIDEIKRLITSFGSPPAAVFGRKWEDSPAEDLTSLRDQLVRQIARSKK